MNQALDTQKRNTYWNTFQIQTGKSDLWYHLAGADKDITKHDNKLAPDLMLYYEYRFAFEEQLIDKLLKTHAPKRQHALDCGGGTGRVANIFAKTFDSVDCFDVSEHIIEENKKRFKNVSNIHFFVSDFSDLKNLGKKYDVIFVGGVFMCMSDIEVMNGLSQIHELLTEDGILIVRDTISKKETYVHNEIKMYRSEKDYEYLFQKTRFRLSKKMNSANRNVWCSIFRRLPALLQKNKLVYALFGSLMRETIGVDVKKVMKTRFNRHALSNQLFYVFQK